MNKGIKYTLESLYQLKTRVKEIGTSITNYYTRVGFKPDNTFPTATETSDHPEIDPMLCEKMVQAFDPEIRNEFEAGKILYEGLKLTPLQASDIAFWTYHNHFTFYAYIAKRWPGLWDGFERGSPINYVLDHWVNSTQNEHMRRAISSLWWSFYLTEDKKRKNPFELTEIFFQNYTLRVIQLGVSRFARHKPAILGVLEFIRENNLDNHTEEFSREVVPYINQLGGIKLLTYFDKDWFKEKLKAKFSEALSQKGNGKQTKADTVIANSKQLITKETTSLSENSFYFCLNKHSGEYKLSTKKEFGWSYLIKIDKNEPNQYLIHFYKEGKIKKTKIDEVLIGKKVNRSIFYKNGKCPRFSIYNFALIKEPVLFGIAYKKNSKIFFKAMDEQDSRFFRVDNSDLGQEGKQILDIKEPYEISYEILPYTLKESLQDLIQGPQAKGAYITNNDYQESWSVLKGYWPELFNGSVEWL